MTTLVLAKATELASPLLRLIAPAYADVLAALWPAPHTPFVTAPTARRHLICLMLATETGRGAAADVDLLLAAPLRKAVRLVLDPAPEGLARALERLGEIAWAPEDYRVLVALLGDPKPAKTLRHAERIDPLQVRTLGALPRPLRDAGGAAVRVGAAQAKLLAEAHALLARRLPEAVLAERIAVWTRAPNAKALFNLVADDFRRELPKPPHPGTEQLRPLETVAAIRDAARRYRNCLANYVDAAVGRRWALYARLPEPRGDRADARPLFRLAAGPGAAGEQQVGRRRDPRGDRRRAARHGRPCRPQRLADPPRPGTRRLAQLRAGVGRRGDRRLFHGRLRVDHSKSPSPPLAKRE
jgi:hypothetical protein